MTTKVDNHLAFTLESNKPRGCEMSYKYDPNGSGSFSWIGFFLLVFKVENDQLALGIVVAMIFALTILAALIGDDELPANLHDAEPRPRRRGRSNLKKQLTRNHIAADVSRLNRPKPDQWHKSK